MFDLSSLFDGIQAFVSQIFGFYSDILNAIFGGLLG